MHYPSLKRTQPLEKIPKINKHSPMFIPESHSQIRPTHIFIKIEFRISHESFFVTNQNESCLILVSDNSMIFFCSELVRESISLYIMENKLISEAVCYTHGQLSKSISTIPRFKPMEARSFLKETCVSFLESNQSAIMKESRDVFCIFNYFHYTSYFFPKVYPFIV